MTESLSNNIFPSTSKKENSVSTSYQRPIFVALAIIALIGVTIGAIGFLSFGGCQSWWSPVLNQITEMQTIIMMGTGGSALLISIIVASALNKILKTAPEQQILPPTPNQNVPSHQNVILNENPPKMPQTVTPIIVQTTPPVYPEPAPGGSPLIQNLKEADLSPLSSIQKAHELFSYEQLAEQKYRVVLEEYIRHLENFSFMEKKVKGLLRHDSNNKMLNELQKLVTHLRGSGENPRDNYHEVILALRNVIESNEYKKISDLVLDEKTDDYKIRSFIRNLCLIRWSGTHLYPYLEDIVHLTMGEDQLPPFTLESFSQIVLQVNQQVEDSEMNKKSRAALAKQKLSGTLGLEDYCGNQNPPHVRLTQVYQDRDGKTLPIASVRHGSPTALGKDYYKLLVVGRKIVAPLMQWVGFDMDTGEQVTSDYKEYLKALEEKGKSELFCIHQRRTSNWIENERERVLKIEALQTAHPNLFVLVQPVEGNLFNRQGPYAKIVSFKELKSGLETEFFDNPHSATALPLVIQKDPTYRKAFRKLLDDVQDLFFSEDKMAFDPNQGAYFSKVNQDLDKIYVEQKKTIKDFVSTLDLQTLKKSEATQIHHEVVEGLMNDKNFIPIFVTKIQEQIRETKQLTPWISLDPASDLEACFNSPKVMQEVTAQMLMTIASNVLKEDHRAELLEEEKAKSLTTWQSFILLFYAFQRKEMMFRLNEVSEYPLSVIKTICKDGLDRGGIQGFIDDRLNDYMQKAHDQPARMEAALYNLIGPPIAVKKQGVIRERIRSGAFVEKRLERLSQSPEWCEKLSHYSFGERQWKLTAIEMPREIAQSGIPPLKRTIKEALKDMPHEKVPDILNRYTNINFDQWEEISNFKIEQDLSLDWVISKLIENHAIPSIRETIGKEQFESFIFQSWDENPIQIETEVSSQRLYRQSYLLTLKDQGEALCTFQTWVRIVYEKPNSNPRCYMRWLIT